MYTKQHVSWKQYLANEELHKNLPKLMNTICESQVQFSGYSWRNKQVVLQIIPANLNNGKRLRGQLERNFINQLTDKKNCVELWMVEIVGKKKLEVFV